MFPYFFYKKNKRDKQLCFQPFHLLVVLVVILDKSNGMILPALHIANGYVLMYYLSVITTSRPLDREGMW